MITCSAGLLSLKQSPMHPSRQEETSPCTRLYRNKKCLTNGFHVSTPPIYQTNHASGELHCLPRYVARRRTTTALGGFSLNQLPRALVGSRNVSLSLNAIPTRAIRKAALEIPKAFLYGGLVTIQPTRADLSVTALKHSSEDVS